MSPEAFAQAYPYLAEIAQQLTESPYDYDTEFESGLDLILDGIERLRRRTKSSKG